MISASHYFRLSCIKRFPLSVLPGSLRKKLFLLLAGMLTCMFLQLSASTCQAAEADNVFKDLPAPCAPYLAKITAKGASLLAKEEQGVLHEGKESFVRLLLPKDASNMQFRVENAIVADIAEKNISLPAKADSSSMYSALLARKNKLSAEILWLMTKITQAQNSTAGKISEEIQADCTRMAQAQAELDEVSKSLASEKEPERVWKLVTLRLLKADALKKAEISYSYHLGSCSWKPVYTMSCTPSAPKPITARLEAVISQTSGMDWKETEIQLINGNAGSAILPDLRQWHIGSAAESAASPMPAALGAPRAKMMALNDTDEEAAPDFAGSSASASADTGGSYVVWKPVIQGLSAGTSRVLLTEGSWQEKLFWTARPLNNDARVYICAEHTLSAEEAVWPEGTMQLSVDGTYAGQGYFRPRDGKIFLSFGNDPRVTLTAQSEPRKKGQQGFIGAKQVWEWGWTYTVRNDRESDIEVRIERPLPVSTNKDVAVSFSGTPAPREDQKEKKLVWTATVPARSATSIQHAVKATAPKDMEMYPVEP